MNVTYKLDLSYKTKNDSDASPNRNKEYLKSTAQKPTMSKEELKSVCNLLLFEDSWTVEPRPPCFNGGYFNF